MKLAIVGGAGFIGSEMVRQLVGQSAEITVVDALTYAGNLYNLSGFREQIEFEELDIRDTDRVKQFFNSRQFDCVINFAAETHVDNSINSPGIFLETNVMGTYNLLEASRSNCFRFIQVSTDEIYGSTAAGKFLETDNFNPSSPYSASKASAEMLVQSYIRTFSIEALIVRCSNNYGHFQHREKLIPAFIYRAMNRKRLPIYGDGLNVREWIHVSDCVAAIIKVVIKGRAGEFYNISSGIFKNNLEVAKVILDYFQADMGHIDYVKDRPGHDFRYAIDSSKIRSELGWEPEISFEQGMEATIKWYTEHPSFLVDSEIFDENN